MCNSENMSFELPEELLECILKRLTRHIDILHFGQVCRSWRHVAMINHNRLPLLLPIHHCLHRHPLPLLMLPWEEGSNICNFFSPSDQKVVGSLNLPEADKKWICGSSNGWLVVVVDSIYPEEVLLFNPITGLQISLPPLSTFTIPQDPSYLEAPRRCTFLRKVILSSEPNSKSTGCIVMAVVSNHQKLAFCRIGDDKWTVVEDAPIVIEDLICHKGQIYLTNQRGVVFACNVNGPKAEVREVVGPASAEDVAMKKYLVESSGELLQVIRDNNDWEDDDDIYRTTYFKIFKLDEGLSTWDEVKSLGDQMLFLGTSCSLSISVSDCPNCPRNCIHFTDDVHMMDFSLDAVRDVGTFYLEDNHIEFYDAGSQIFNMSPIWVVPKPWLQK